jgi:NADH-quinone oxidoreductase subunit M
MITTLLIFFPLVAALLVFLAGQRLAATVGILATIIEFFFAVSAFMDFNSAKLWNYEVMQPWIASLGINYAVGMDGISLALVLLTTFLLPLILATALSGSLKDKKEFFALALVMEAALIGVFTSKDLFLFYIFWELALIPIYFICLLWGDENRRPVTFKFFIYTLFGSLFMLVAIIYLYLQTPEKSFALEYIYKLSLSGEQQTFVFWALFLAFAIKMPVFPVHTWQPPTYTSAPIPGTMLLSGIMLKMGIYGVLRWILPVVPSAVTEWGCLAVTLSVIGIVYASVIAIKQQNYKTLIAYVSIAHVGLISAGLFSNSMEGLQGVVLQMLAHGVNVVGLFFIIDIILKRTGTLELSKLGGLRNQAPQLAVFFIVILMASIALPMTNGFAGEFLLFVGIFKYNPYIAGVAGLTIILGSVYMLSSFQKIMLGEAKPEFNTIQDLTLNEKAVLIPIVIAIFVFGLFPNIMLDLTDPSIKAILHSVQKTLPVAN